MPINTRPRRVFADCYVPGPTTRTFTFDEAGLVALYVETLTQRGTAQPHSFNVADLLRMIGSTDEHKYLAPAWDLLQRLASAGVIVASNPARANGPRPLLSYRFTGTIAPSPTQWALGSAALALGLPYVADAYADITVRVHAHRGRQESIWQWFCSRQGSNRHKLSCRREGRERLSLMGRRHTQGRRLVDLTSGQRHGSRSDLR
jgi:hypothetical protein